MHGKHEVAGSIPALGSTATPGATFRFSKSSAAADSGGPFFFHAGNMTPTAGHRTRARGYS